jgi:hypothetical protein
MINPNDKSQNVFECMSTLLKVSLPNHKIPIVNTPELFTLIFSISGECFDCPVGLIIDEYDTLMDHKSFNSMLRSMKQFHENYWIRVALIINISLLLLLGYLNLLFWEHSKQIQKS